MGLKIVYQVTYEFELYDEEDVILGDETPEEYLKASMENCPEALLEESKVLKVKFLKSTNTVGDKADADEDDEDLTVLDEEELNFEE